MKCPLLTMYATTFDTPERFQDRDCLKEECAWWDEAEKECVIIFLEKDLAGIWTMLLGIKDKMPHAEQFKR